MQEKGAKMGELQIKLLQKIEELTLYAIDQNQRLRAIERDNQELRQMIKTR